MAEVPPRDPRDPAEDETVVVDDWGPETVVVEQSQEPPPRRPIPTLWPWLLALLVLVLGGIAAAYAISRDDDDEAAAPTTTATQQTSAEVLVVPDVVGTTSSEATAALREAGFEANLVSVPSERPPGIVVAQDPAAGTEASESSRVRLNVAVAGETSTTTEATTQATTEAATTAEPATTETAPAGATAPATVPDVVGQELADAARAFADERLKVSVRYVPSREAAGRVVAQARPAGTVLRRGDTVQLNVSGGPGPPAPAAVPDVTGRRLDRAREAVEQAGFEVLAIDLATGSPRNESVVDSQSPPAAANIPGGSLVLLYVR